MIEYFLIEWNGKIANKFYSYQEAIQEVQRLHKTFKNIVTKIIKGYE